MHQKLLGEEHPFPGRDLNFPARLKHEPGTYNEAEQLFNQSLILYQKTLPTAYPFVALAKIDPRQLFLDRNRPAEAEAPLRDALRIRQTRYGDYDVRTAEAKPVLGVCLTALVQYTEAEPSLEASLALFQDQQHSESTRQTRQVLVNLYRAWGKPAQAARHRAR